MEYTIDVCVCVLCVWVVSPFARSRVLAIDIFHHRWTGSGMKWLCLYCFIAERRRVAGMSNNICNKTNMQTCRLIQVCGGCFHVFWAATASVKYLTVYKLCALGPFDRGEEFMDAENCFDLCSWTKPLAATKKKVAPNELTCHRNETDLHLVFVSVFFFMFGRKPWARTSHSDHMN